MPIVGSPKTGSFHVTVTRRSASSLSIVMPPARWAVISGAGSRSAGRMVRLPGGGAGRQRKCRSAVARSEPLTYSMSVIRFAAKFTVRWRSACAEASQISGSGGPAPNGCGVLSKVGSSGRDGVAKTLLIWRLLILIRGAQGALSGRRSQGAGEITASGLFELVLRRRHLPLPSKRPKCHSRVCVEGLERRPKQYRKEVSDFSTPVARVTNGTFRAPIAG